MHEHWYKKFAPPLGRHTRGLSAGSRNERERRVERIHRRGAGLGLHRLVRGAVAAILLGLDHLEWAAHQ